MREREWQKVELSTHVICIFPGHSSPLHSSIWRWRGYIRSQRMIQLLYLLTPKTTHTDSNLNPALCWPPTFSYPVRSCCISDRNNKASSDWLPGYALRLCMSRFMNEPASRVSKASWLAGVCVDRTSRQKMCDFPCSHSWAVRRFVRPIFQLGNAWRNTES